MSSVWIDLNELWIKIDSNSVAANIITVLWQINENWMNNEIWINHECNS